jgi:arylsulfatase A-like enzyme
LHAELAEGRRDASRSSRVIAVTPAEARQAIALAWGTIAMIDAMIGDVMRTVAELGLDRDTVVVFVSDHGDFMGDHGLLFKGPLHYRSLIRMPFIWRDPAGPAHERRSQLASAIDFAPTVLARAGVAPYFGLQGIDLGQAIHDVAAPTRDAVLIEEESHRAHPGTKGPSRVRSLVTPRWRLSVHAGEAWGELYDLDDDPAETVNRWEDPRAAQVRAELLWHLADRMTELAHNGPLPTRMA